MKRAAAVGALLLATLASPANATERGVAIPGKLFEPEHLQLLVGDTVTWTNQDAATHTVTADDASFDSGDLNPDGTFTVRFTHPGRTTYHCAIHRFMTGVVEVYALTLSGPVEPVSIGTQFALRGLARPDAGRVTVERRGQDEAFAPVSEAAVAADGSFEVFVPAVTSADYRAVSGTLESAVLHVGVTPRVVLRVRRAGSAVRVVGSVSPAEPGIPVALQVYSRERFAWDRFARGRLDARSRVRFTIHPRRKLKLRLVVLGGSRGLVGGTSNGVLAGPTTR